MVDEQVAVEHGTVSHTISREEDGVVHERRVLASGERVEVFYKAPAPRPREGRASTFHDFTVPAAAAVPGPEPEPEPHPPMPIHANGEERPRPIPRIRIKIRPPGPGPMPKLKNGLRRWMTPWPRQEGREGTNFRGPTLSPR